MHFKKIKKKKTLINNTFATVVVKNNVINQPLTYSWRRNSTYALKRNSLKKNIVQTDVNFKDEA